MISTTEASVSQTVSGLERIILVDLNVKSPEDAPKAYSVQFDRKKIKLEVPYDSEFFTLEDYSLAEDPLEGPDCFFPQLKMIFRTETYVFSLYCTSVIRYRNQSPFVPSGKRIHSEIKVTKSVLSLLQETHREYFGDTFDPVVANRFVKREKLKEIDNTVDDSPLLNEADEDTVEDQRLEIDASDKEGWFDNHSDPGLESDDNDDLDLDGDIE